MSGNCWKIFEIVGMAGCGWNWLEMAGNGWKWIERGGYLEISRNGVYGQKLLEMAKIAKKKMAVNVWKRAGISVTGCIFSLLFLKTLGTLYIYAVVGVTLLR